MKDIRTNEELNRIIAEWMGWKLAVDRHFNGLTNAGQQHGDDSRRWKEIPHYCFDLNAIHEAVDKLPEGPYTWWSNNLMQLCGTHLKSVNAGPRQRAEALVAVIEGEIK